jgi:hypothetical protein
LNAIQHSGVEEDNADGRGYNRVHPSDLAGPELPNQKNWYRQIHAEQNKPMHALPQSEGIHRRA